VAKSDRVLGGAMLEVDLDEEPREAKVMPETVAGLRIVFDDDDIVVVDKPVWVAAHPSLGWTGPSVLGHLAGAGFRISTSGVPERRGIVQRLDVGTSGLMVVAKSERAYTVLKRAFKSRTVDKTYHTLVQGHPDPFTGTIDAPIGRHPGPEYKMAVTADGRPSITHYDTLDAFVGTTLLEVKLETGRTHQIRVHMAAVKHPCVGDPTYGADPVLAARLGLERQWLHAVRLAFTHPTTGDQVEFSSPYPGDLEHALAVARAT
jgi:23S rRNA pseudouridine1911/1915/1917 synthase